MTTQIMRLALSDDEARSVRSLLDEITAEPANLDQYRLLDQAPVLAHELPRRVREAFYRLGRDEDIDALVVTDNPTLRAGPGPTPGGYVETEAGFALNDAQVLHGLYGSLLGEAVGFTSQRGGSVYNTIIPLPEMSLTANSSSGSAFDFGFHVEDAFHPARAEFVGLLCLRNDELAPTTVSSIEGIELSDDEVDALFEPRFRIGHNLIHTTSGLVSEDHQAVFFGARQCPYVRINFATLDVGDYSGIERRALDKLLRHFERDRVTVTLQTSDCIYIDNFRCVHARDAFTPLPAGRCRWLNRVVFTSDLRKSRALRGGARDRSIAA